ncbi:MAG: DUF3276 family protein [Alkalispirochaeta sp.]
MGVRGELFSARVKSKNDRRTYFFNVKENRNNDVFVTVVESKKSGEGEAFDRHQVVVFEEDLRLFRKGLDTVLEFLESRDGGRGTGDRRSRSPHTGDRKPVRLKRRAPQKDSDSADPAGDEADSGDNGSESPQS